MIRLSIRFAALSIALAAIACGGQDTNSGSSSTAAVEDTPPVSAAPGAGDAGARSAQQAARDTAAGAASTAQTHPSVTNCLDLVAAGRMADAIAPCTEAVKKAPGNREVAEALSKARSAATASAAEAAKSAGATADAAGKLGQGIPKP